MDNPTTAVPDPWAVPPGTPATPEPIPFYCYGYGWICPRCGRGNAPFVHTCACMPLPAVVTCGSTTTKFLTE